MDPIARLLANPPDLPVLAVLPRVASALREAGIAVVTAPPGSGKTTLIPPLMARLTPGRILVTQPRRVAVRAAARRLAHLLGEGVGGTVGFSVRGERTTSQRTRVEFVTTGVLLRALQRDPELPGVAGVVLDEMHERALESDLVQAMLIDVRATLRPDLPIAVMSATLDARAVSQLWTPASSGPVPIIHTDGALFPVAIHWCPPARPLPRTDERGVTRAHLEHVAATTRRALAENAGDVLVFVPGAREVDVVARALAGVDADVLRLYGRLPAAEQDRALSEGGRRRVVVSTAVAESSLTVPGVRVVVDGGLARRPRIDLRRGLPGLVTVPVSQASADQRAGRAGRLGPGAAYRTWSQADHARLAAFDLPEIATADLTSFALEALCWTPGGAADLALLDPPPAAALSAAMDTLRGLDAVDDSGTATRRGQEFLRVPADPRLARALLDGAEFVGPRAAAEVVALLAEDVPAPGGDLAAALRLARRGGPGTGEWGRSRDRLAAIARDVGAGKRDHSSLEDPSATRSPDGLDARVAQVVAMAHPERVARRRGLDRYLMASGAGAALPQGSALVGSEWLALADVDRSRPGDALIRSAVPIDAESALEAAAALLSEQVEVAIEGRRVRARLVRRLGGIELSARTLDRVPPEGAVALRQALGEGGLGMLRWTERATSLRHRLAFLHRVIGEPWPDVSDAALLARSQEWLPGELTDLGRIDPLGLLRGLLPWPEASRLEELAPQRLTLPSGRSAAVAYDGEQPVVASRLQDFFGLGSTPRLADGRVPVLVHLLSPAGRPAAITSDLAGFWANGYQAVRSDLRGRYPKHSWPPVPPSPGESV